MIFVVVDASLPFNFSNIIALPLLSSNVR